MLPFGTTFEAGVHQTGRCCSACPLLPRTASTEDVIPSPISRSHYLLYMRRRRMFKLIGTAQPSFIKSSRFALCFKPICGASKFVLKGGKQGSDVLEGAAANTSRSSAGHAESQHHAMSREFIACERSELPIASPLISRFESGQRW